MVFTSESAARFKQKVIFFMFEVQRQLTVKTLHVEDYNSLVNLVRSLAPFETQRKPYLLQKCLNETFSTSSCYQENGWRGTFTKV